MDKARRKEALKQLHRIETTYDSIVMLEEGHEELVKLRLLYDGNLFVETADYDRVVPRSYAGNVRSYSKKTAVYKDDKLIKTFPSVKQAAEHFGIPYTTVKKKMKQGSYTRNGYTFRFLG